MKIAFYGSSLLSSYWNGAATYYRGLLARPRRGAATRSPSTSPTPSTASSTATSTRRTGPRSCVYPATEAAVARRRSPRRREADVVVKASGVGVFDDVLLEGVMAAAAPGRAPHLLGRRRAGDARRAARPTPTTRCAARCRRSTSCSPMAAARRWSSLRAASARARCVPDLQRARPRRPTTRCRRSRASPPTSPSSATACPTARRGSSSSSSTRPRGCRSAASCSAATAGTTSRCRQRPPPRPRRHARPQRLQQLARSRCSTSPATAWPTIGFSPATRVFEAAGAGACLITDAWEGLELFLEAGRGGAGRPRRRRTSPSTCAA